MTNPAAHGFSQILYEFSSASANNGSAFEGLAATWGFNDPDANASPPGPVSPYFDIVTGLVMLISRFVPIIAPVALAGSLALKKPTPFTVGHAAHRHASRSGCSCSERSCWSAPCCSCPRRCWGRWPNTSARIPFGELRLPGGRGREACGRDTPQTSQSPRRTGTFPRICAKCVRDDPHRIHGRVK